MSKKQDVKYEFVSNYLVKLFGTLVLATVGLIVFILLTQFVLRDLIIQFIYGTFIYDIMIYLKQNLLLLSILFLLVIYSVIILFYMRGLTRYINEIIRTSSHIYDSNQKIEMSYELKEVESQFMKIKKEVERSKLAAKEAERRKNDLLVYLAHDLKTPLTSIIGYLTLLVEEEQLPKEIHQKYLAIAKDKSLRLEDLLNEFFEITRFNLSSIELEVETVNFGIMIEQMVFELMPVYKQKNIACISDIDNDIKVRADVNKLQRAIDNLLMNAYYYSYENSEIVISLKKVDHQALLTITNQAKTIPFDKLEKIFEQFYRLDGARSTDTGKSGLGLAITKEIVDAHHGTITAESYDEKIIFKIELELVS